MYTNSSEMVECAIWSHYCYECEILFDAVDLHDPCPDCGLVDRRETVSLDPYFNAYYGIQTPESWETIIALEDFAAGMDTELAGEGAA